MDRRHSNLLRFTRHSHKIYSLLTLIMVGSLLCNPLWAKEKDSIEISSSNDFEAPDITHDIDKDIVKDVDGNVTIRARVTDEFSVNSVVLFFRDGENDKYRKRPMTPDEQTGKNIFKCVIPHTALSGSRIEYYFEADDRVGNKKLKGLEFSPLKRNIGDLALGNGKTKDEEQVAEPEPEVTTEQVAETPKEPVKKDEIEKDAKNWDHPMTSMDAPIIWVPGL